MNNSFKLWSPFYPCLLLLLHSSLSVIAKNPLLNLRSWWFILLRILWFWLLYLGYWDTELIFDAVWDQNPIWYFYMWISSCPSIICWRNYSFFIEFTWHPCEKLVVMVYGVIWGLSTLFHSQFYPHTSTKLFGLV